MKEYMLLIRNEGDGKAGMSAEKHLEFVTACELYIGKLKAENRLIAAQPLIREGTIIRNTAGAWHKEPFTVNRDIQVGYYHILANNLDEAIAIAKENPEFAFNSGVSVEVRPIKTKEEQTGFSYPK